MKLIITRHGETEENKKNINQGQIDGTLSLKGIAQAKSLAERLINEPLEIIYASDLQRALDTAKLINKGRNIPLIEEKSLREKYFGIFQGKDYDYFYKYRGTSIDNSEKNIDLFNRAKNFILKITKDKHKYVLIVGHSRINHEIINYLRFGKQVPLERGNETSNTSVTIFNISKLGEINEILFNCTAHHS